MKKLLAQLKVRSRALAKHPSVEDCGASVVPPDSNAAMKRFEKAAGVRLPPVMREFYGLCDGFSLGWRADVDHQAMRGASQIRPISALHSLEVGLGESMPPPPLTGDWFILDQLGATGNYVLVSFQDAGVQLYLYTYHRHCNRMSLSFEEYLERDVRWLGMELWQAHYIDKPPDISDHYVQVAGAEVLSELLGEEVGGLSFPSPSASTSRARDKCMEALTALAERGVEITTKDLPPGCSPNAIMKAQAFFGTPLPAEVIDFYRDLNGLSVRWQSASAAGALLLLPLEVVFGGEEHYLRTSWCTEDDHKGKVWVDDDTDEYLELAKRMRPIEFFEGSSNFVGFVLRDSVIELYYSYSPGELFRLPIGIADYLDISVQLLGISGWVEYYLEGADARVGTSNVLESIRETFPSFDLSRLDPGPPSKPPGS